MTGLYYLIEWVIHRLIRVSENCRPNVFSVFLNQNPQKSWWTTSTIINKGNLMHPFGIVQHAKVTFQKHSTNLLSIENVKANLLKIILSTVL